MFFKLKDRVLFRRYAEYGYLTDNSMFGYHFLNDNNTTLEEKFVSESGAVMLEMLDKAPQDLDCIVKKLMDVFVGVGFDELKQDTLSFFMQLVEAGYLSCGESPDLCSDDYRTAQESKRKSIIVDNGVVTDNCSKWTVPKNDLLRSIHIEVANVCNERCVHCYIPHKYKKKSIDSKLFYQIVEDGRELNIINVTLSGGEPLLHPDFIKFLVRCRALDLSVNVLSNLTLLTTDILSEMKRNPLLSVQTSIYSMDAHTHDAITGVEGSLEKTKTAVEQLISEGIPVQISCPIMKQNKDSFSDVIKWGNFNNISVLADNVIFAAYDHSNENLQHRLSLEEVETVFDKQLTHDYAESLRRSAREKCMATGNDPICTICRYYFCVSVDGEVFPCVGWQSKVIGNLNDCSIKEIWEESKEIQYLRKIKRNQFPKCVTCEDRGYCTVCMMSNSNEDSDGDMFRIHEFHCKVASMMHSKVDSYFKQGRE